MITPYLAQPGTQFYVEAFQEAAKANGWDVNVIDTKGDVAAAISSIEDAANQKVDAIVINVDPGQVAAGLETAKSAGIPVFGMDAGANPLLVTNVTSNGYRWPPTPPPMSPTGSTARATLSCSYMTRFRPCTRAT